LALFIKVDFIIEIILKDKEDHLTMKKMPTYQEDIIIINTP
jgi:hypothetical protein